MSQPAAKFALRPASAATPVARFSPGVAKAGIVQVAGQIGVDPESEEPVSTDLAEQVRLALRNVESVLGAGGAKVEDVLMLRVYLTDTEHFAVLNEVYDEWITERCPSGVWPARTTVYVGLPAGLLVEIDALAVLG